jgi:MATE family multidrug resistance protein
MSPPIPRLLPTRPEFRELTTLALPVVAVQLGLMAMGVVDSMMAGRLSAQALAAVALGNLFFFTVAIIGMGTLLALDPVVSQAVGARDEPAIARGLQRGLIMAVLLSIPSAAALLLVRPALAWSGQPAELIPLATRYVHVIVPGVLPFFVFIVFRQSLQALGRIAPILWIALLANILNAVLNWAFMYGNLGSPPMGVTGSALATTVSRWAMALGLFVVARRELLPRLHPWRPESLDPGALTRMMRIGFPIGAQMFFEYGVFSVVGALMGRFGTMAVAGHQVALNLASIVFMVPQGIGAAVAVLVGRAIGAEDLPRARRAALGAILLGGGFMAGSAVLFVLVPGALARLYSADAVVVSVAGALIVLGGIFAVFDGLQAVAIGVLRGIGDTTAPVLISMVGYWIVGMPVSLLLGFRYGMGPEGLWWGLVLGLMVTAPVLLGRIRSRFQRTLRRILIDHPEAEPGEA